MDLRIFTEPQQGATYDDLVRVARAAEDFGYDAFFRSDHYLAMSTDGLPGPTDAWITLAGIARETSTIRLGTLVTSATFRYPGPLAISVAQVDAMSAGRVELGLGAGWYADEHAAYAIPFPSVGTRFDRFEETLAIVTGLWGTPAGETFSYQGDHFTVAESPALPKPVQSPPPIIIGGMGKKRTPELAARHATEFNLPFADTDATATQFDRVRAACSDIGRDPSSMTFSNALVLCCGTTEDEIARRAAAIGRDVDELRANGAAGTPAEIVDKLGTYAELGSTRFYLQMLDLSDLDHIELVAAEVMRQLA
ncbi:LLM class F420-dependent oxidoreductase [Rhodococcus sp. BP-349]|uniref:LLM class F420-dependent oxidoreductase n=1 Tax=unclassified Rhodococcus (in: high G+C Gram-positive bacteria) TaxID=192944 RepID=UPI001C9A4841|nr:MULTISPECIES: LLM class F420-dependent oxidoreductase [unclassified Rhodococcus (in: high G+C Gram-positive bacteria)]MBY6539109.1 LLM class F420-dependent oxidoreductase [Rhodococcus sp. BP-363]MBY6544563.1 LLM class F420-dependent oxidoreductase [Rhodococcus sp. BP-369]MBY6563793.1 LLM class F420-dependent oxidoreductase [Rhodococcus sp. BP-370]MBY6578085.1 LLM class F420-dependent oxidoreductase [Rhodococcus sp. BP-364]MBY6587386.1 LLM class F420-dependent oxidoreductase [Rhodococcus sp.